MSVLYQRVRSVGSCPPSLLLEECSKYDNLDGFETAMSKIIDDNGAYQLVRRPRGHDDSYSDSFLLGCAVICFIFSILAFCLRPGQDVAKDLKEVLQVSSFDRGKMTRVTVYEIRVQVS